MNKQKNKNKKKTKTQTTSGMTTNLNKHYDGETSILDTQKRAGTFATSIQDKPTRRQLMCLRENTLREGGSQANKVEAGATAA